MTAKPSVLAVIPARGGSKGLPGKNIREFAGLPLIAHSILFAKMCPEISRVVVSTDSTEIAAVSREYGSEVPFMRPSELAEDDTAMWPVLRHALEATESLEDKQYDYVLLLDPTSPAREPADVSGALEKIEACPEADGILAVSQPDFNPIWHCVVERDGWMTDLIAEGREYDRRQDVPPVYRIHGSLYIWRTSFMRNNEEEWRGRGKHLVYVTPEFRSLSFDSIDEFDRGELMVKGGIIKLPWMSGVGQ